MTLFLTHKGFMIDYKTFVAGLNRFHATGKRIKNEVIVNFSSYPVDFTYLVPCIKTSNGFQCLHHLGLLTANFDKPVTYKNESMSTADILEVTRRFSYYRIFADNLTK